MIVGNYNNHHQDTHDKYTDAYVNILNAYKEQISKSVIKKNELKENFLNTIRQIMNWLTWIFAGALVISLVLFVIMAWKNSSSASVIAGAITTIFSSFITMIISIFQLPRIIANYLFNKEEDKLMSDIIQNIQKYEIDAVKHDLENLRYELERVKLEKLKELNPETSNNINVINSDSDNALTDFTYNIPVQNQNANIEYNIIIKEHED